MTVSRESVDETEIRRDPSKVGASVVSSEFSGIHSIYFAHHCLKNSAAIPLSIDNILGVDAVRDVVIGVSMV